MNPRLTLALIIAVSAAPPLHAESFNSWAARGAREEREKDPQSAVASYSNALSLWDEDDGASSKAKVLCARANLREKDGDDAGAIEDFTGCLALDKKNAKNFHRRGALLIKAGKTAAAIGDFYKAIAIDIRFAQAYADRASAYESQGDSGFAREDWRNACNFGHKAACAKVKEFSPKRAPKASKKKPKAAPAASNDAPPAEAAPAEAAPAEEPVEEAAPAAPAPPPKKRPKFTDCVKALDACVEGGDSFGTCVRKAPDCDKKADKGCCPAACFKAYQKLLNHDRSEAQAFREVFTAGAACGKPPKTEEESD